MGRPKSLIEIDGEPMARRVATAMTRAGCESVVAVGPLPLAAGLEHVADLHPGEGPLGGILTALQATGGAPTLVAACDLPWLDAASLALIIEAAGRGEDVVVARSSRLEPMCALWQPSAAPKLQAVFDGGERAVHRAMATLDVVEVDLPDSVLANVNAPDDLPSE
jgi:molybdopterin-guanine dinucleotide biosynthesis protein A